MKEPTREVLKVWGKEFIIVNRPEYCAKLLYLDACAVSSLHRHLRKTETFYGLENRCTLWVEGQFYDLNPQASSVTILSGQWHEFTGPVSGVARILEVSTHHDEADVERKTESRKVLETR